MPLSYRLAQAANDYSSIDRQSFTNMASMAGGGMLDIFKNKPPPHSQHPDFGHLILLVFEAVLEVVCVAFPGYIVARQGMFDAEAQKFTANLNVMLFTPCLIFTKLASQLTAEKLVELAVIPFIFAVQTLVSYLCAIGVSKLFRFKKRPQNFVVAMGVFGNSNSLPISLVISLSKTLSGLHWDKIPGDNDDEVAARGILYLLIFQQLGQLVRWSWGYHVLLAPPDKYSDEPEGQNAIAEEGRYRDEPLDDERREFLADVSESGSESEDDHSKPNGKMSNGTLIASDSDYGSGSATPLNRDYYSSSDDSSSLGGTAPGANGHPKPAHTTSFPTSNTPSPHLEAPLKGIKGMWQRTKQSVHRGCSVVGQKTSSAAHKTFSSLPSPIQKVLSKIGNLIARFFAGLWEFMNPPLWAMLAAIIVASVPKLQHLFFSPGTFLSNSVTRAVAQSGSVAVPLILVVLGANLARNTLPKEQRVTGDDPKEERNLLIASIVSRMLLPTIMMAPLLALTAKYVPVSILDDPIFVIVCFLLTGAPSALQLAQICQINNVYMGAMARLLFQSYVVWILPSTLILVMLALETVEWAA